MHNRIYQNLYHFDPQLTKRASEARSKKVTSLVTAKGKAATGTALKSPLPLPYQLQVETKVGRDKLPFLINKGARLVELIESTTLTLTHAAWQVTSDSVSLFMNWDMGFDADALTEAELILPDIPEYAEFERLIIDETKNIVVPMSMARRPALTQEAGELRCNLPLTDRYVYVRATYQVEARDLAEFAALLEGALWVFARDYGWYDGRTFIGLTGRAGELVQHWLVPEAGAALAAQRLASAPWRELSRNEPIVRVLEPTPTDPVIKAFKQVVADHEARSVTSERPSQILSSKKKVG